MHKKNSHKLLKRYSLLLSVFIVASLVVLMVIAIVQDRSRLTNTEQSAAATNLGPSINFIFPAGGETLNISSQYTITWNFSGDPTGKNLTIYLDRSLFGGGNPIEVDFKQAVAGGDSISWTVPFVTARSNYRILISVSSGQQFYSNPFTIANATATATAAPTASPSPTPSPTRTASPTPIPTPTRTASPTASPTRSATPTQSPSPTSAQTSSPTNSPNPSSNPTSNPTNNSNPTSNPTAAPSSTNSGAVGGSNVNPTANPSSTAKSIAKSASPSPSSAVRIAIVSPNGGEFIPVGTQQTVKWDFTPATQLFKYPIKTLFSLAHKNVNDTYDKVASFSATTRVAKANSSIWNTAGLLPGRYLLQARMDPTQTNNLVLEDQSDGTFVVGSQLQVYAAGTSADGEYPTMQIAINNRVVKTVYGVRGNPFSREFMMYSYFQGTKIDPRSVSVKFVNDKVNEALNEDRNLVVDKIVIDGKAFETEAKTTVSTGTWVSGKGCKAGSSSSEWLMCSGEFRYSP